MASSLFHPVSVATLLTTTPKDTTWVWKPYLPAGSLCIFAAYAKTGKSTFTYALTRAVARGAPFLGYPTTQRPVLILALEERGEDVSRRLRRFGISPEDPVRVHVGALPYPNAMPQVKADVVAQHVGLLIVDTLSVLWAVRDENNNAEVVAQLKPLLDLARDTGCTVLLVHHTGKDRDEPSPVRRIRGASALAGIVDQTLVLAGGAGNQRTLSTRGRYDETPRELVIELEGDTYHRVGTPAEHAVEATKQKVLAALSAAPVTVATIAKAAGVGDKIATKVLHALAAVPGSGVLVTGKGVKGDPLCYRRVGGDADSLSTPIEGGGIGEEWNTPLDDAELDEIPTNSPP